VLTVWDELLRDPNPSTTTWHVWQAENYDLERRHFVPVFMDASIAEVNQRSIVADDADWTIPAIGSVVKITLAATG
jgi:hypothetical protein